MITINSYETKPGAKGEFLVVQTSVGDGACFDSDLIGQIKGAFLPQEFDIERIEKPNPSKPQFPYVNFQPVSGAESAPSPAPSQASSPVPANTDRSWAILVQSASNAAAALTNASAVEDWLEARNFILDENIKRINQGK